MNILPTTPPSLIYVQNLVPLLDKKLTLENFGERFRLQVIVHRVIEWLLGSFKDAVEGLLNQVWASYLESFAWPLRSSHIDLHLSSEALP